MIKNLLNKEELRRMAREHEVNGLADFNQLIGAISKEVLEAMLNGELTRFLGYERYNQNGKNTGNSRNGYSGKTVNSTYGPLEINVPRDRKSEFKPQLIEKGQRDISFLDEKVLSLYAKGMSTRDICRYVEEIYNFKISPETVSTITDGLIEHARQWQSRPLEPLYPIIFLDGFVLKVRVDGQVSPVVVYAILGITMEGRKECLGLWMGGDAESARFWLSIFNELKNRGVKDVLIFCVDNLTGLSEAIEASFPLAEIQKCVVHQIRNSLKYVSYKERKAMAEDLKSIYKAATEEMGLCALDAFEKRWDKRYPTVAKSWRRNWSELSTFYKYPEEIRRLIYTTNPIESMNKGFRKVTKTKSIFPSEDAAFKVLYLRVGEMSRRWTGRLNYWHVIYPQLLIYFKERVEKYL